MLTGACQLIYIARCVALLAFTQDGRVHVFDGRTAALRVPNMLRLPGTACVISQLVSSLLILA
jgi:hypothetical protein